MVEIVKSWLDGKIFWLSHHEKSFPLHSLCAAETPANLAQAENEARELIKDIAAGDNVTSEWLLKNVISFWIQGMLCPLENTPLSKVDIPKNLMVVTQS